MIVTLILYDKDKNMTNKIVSDLVQFRVHKENIPIYQEILDHIDKDPSMNKSKALNEAVVMWYKKYVKP